MNNTIGLIGVGNMGTAILTGLFSQKMVSPHQVFVYDKIRQKADGYSQLWKCHAVLSSVELASKAEVILLAVKPQDLSATMQEMEPGLYDGQVLISILAGIPLEKIQKLSTKKLELVRAMPNLGAKAGQSLTALTSSSKRALGMAESIFSGCGKTVNLAESQFDLITALSGSGPAYFFYLMELMAKEGRDRGLTEAQAKLVAVQTALGAALLASESSDSPAVLREKVTSKGGTTEAALKELMKTFPKTFQDAIQAACERGKELGKG